MAPKSVLIAFCVLSALVCLGSTQPIQFDPEELELAIEGFEPIPLRVQRVKRQEVFGGVNRGAGGGAAGNLGVGGTVFNSNGHRVDAHGQVSKNWKPTGPTMVGGGLDYTGPRGGASITADHNRRLGTDVNAQGHYNIYQSPDRRTTVDAHGGYQRSYGGDFGTSRPNYNVGVGLNHRF